jgi:riboflavin kinase/FMN adenylyltransferase
MKIFRHVSSLPAESRGAVFALGNFDGVHRGHRAVINAARDIAAQSARPFGVVTFEPHPRQYFRPEDPSFRLTPFRAKMHELSELGCDLAVSLHFDSALAQYSAETFVTDMLAEGLGAAHIVVGYDFVFGRGRGGTPDLLRQMGAELGFGVTIVAKATETDGTAFSSTEIRDLLVAGRPRDAATLLGRVWEIDGRVEKGDQIGRTIGYPTANIHLGEYLRPATGIYAVRAGVDMGKGFGWYDAVASLGTRPTVNGSDLRFEVYIFDFAGDLYDRHLRVQIVEWIRPELNFDGLEALKAAIAEDCRTARAILATP